jgi:hypothetical protein
MLRKDAWENWEKSVLEIFSMALRELLSRKPLPEEEKDLNRLLTIIVRECRRKWCLTNDMELPGHPIFQAKGQPTTGDAVKKPKEDKIPDFTWGFTDYLNGVDKNYHVECKRLKEDKYLYCREYVVNGMKRFVEEEWSYGFGCESGLMIGYIQGMEFKDILHWVNHYAKKHSFSPLNLRGSWNKKSISRLENNLKRPKVPISPFKLAHLWVDLR